MARPFLLPRLSHSHRTRRCSARSPTRFGSPIAADRSSCEPRCSQCSRSHSASKFGLRRGAGRPTDPTRSMHSRAWRSHAGGTRRPPSPSAFPLRPPRADGTRSPWRLSRPSRAPLSASSLSRTRHHPHSATNPRNECSICTSCTTRRPPRLPTRPLAVAWAVARRRTGFPETAPIWMAWPSSRVCSRVMVMHIHMIMKRESRRPTPRPRQERSSCPSSRGEWRR
mmetsp:Transcript_29093/g.59578  ORF Transcript_29093/g.59578 Transcript_29093/m.59578 type:complete len:225 (-) Transcript_29093:77-751(-)